MSNNNPKQKNLLFIGGGNIAGAVACGLVNSKTVAPSNVTVYDIDDSKFGVFSKLGINTTLVLKEAALKANFIFLAVKPSIVASVMKSLAEIPGVLSKAVIVSFAAAVSIKHISDAAGAEIPIIRTMPSTPILVGEGVLAVTRNELVAPNDFEYICRIMSSIAYVSVISEDMMNPIISVNGSSPAYVYLFIKAMLDGSESLGIPRETALPLILKTFKGSVTMVEKSGKEIETLIQNVASPNGTTLAALNSFYDDGFENSVVKAMKACTDRANEISKEL